MVSYLKTHIGGAGLAATKYKKVVAEVYRVWRKAGGLDIVGSLQLHCAGRASLG
jgi:hypothetical protein